MIINSALAVTISAVFPGTTPVDQSNAIVGTIKNIYQFSLFIGGILAFGAIVYGGFKYMVSGGNPSSQHEGKEWIQSALLGILLLAGAYLILNTINPALVNLSLPGLTPVTVSATNNNSGSAVSSGIPQCGGTTVGACPAGQTCRVSGGIWFCQ